VIPRSLIAGVLLLWPFITVAATCERQGVQVQVLGSGGPELQTGRASSGYLIWIEGKPRVLVDLGGGAALRFGESGATTSDLDVILLTHLHADHTADLPALIKSSRFEKRTAPLPIYGPVGNKFMPSTVAFVRALFDNTRGAYRYLGGALSPLSKDTYKLQPHNVRQKRSALGTQLRETTDIIPVFSNARLSIRAIPVEHGQIPALAWRINVEGKSVVFSGDMNGDSGNLEHLAQGADLLIAHHAVPEGAAGVARRLHMPPSVIGRIAEKAAVKQLVLSHRMLRTLGKEEATIEIIREHYAGPLTLANDLDCFSS
jgi:ribonuclease BN (tRNA processing enzyme)